MIADFLLSEEQMGFRKGRSRVDTIFTLKRITEERREFNCETHLVFEDLTKASDNVKGHYYDNSDHLLPPPET